MIKITVTIEVGHTLFDPNDDDQPLWEAKEETVSANGKGKTVAEAVANCLADMSGKWGVV